MIASIMRRPESPMTSVMSESSLMLASSSVFCIRWIWLVCSRTSCLRARMNERSSWSSSSGTKLALIRPQATKSAIHMASLTSVLRPGTFLMCAALATISSKAPSLRMFQTGFQ